MGKQLRTFKAPSLPLAPTTYSGLYQEQFNNILRLYFTQLDNFSAALSGPLGGQYINFPRLSVIDTTNQYLPNTTTAAPIQLGATQIAEGVSVVGGSRMTVAQPGTYNVQFSIQFTNPDTAEANISVWFRLNGVDIPNSNSTITVPSKHGSGDGHNIMSIDLFVDMNAYDYVEMVWRTTNPLAFIESVPAGIDPIRPSCPGVICTVQLISSPTDNTLR